MRLYVVFLLVFGTAMEPKPTTQPASTEPAEREVMTLVLGGAQEDKPPLRWQPRGEGSHHASASIFHDLDVVVESPDGRKFSLAAVNVFAHASAGRVWHVSVRPAWPLTTPRDMAGRLRAQLAVWEIPLNDKAEAFLEELDRLGDQPSTGWEGIHGCYIAVNETTSVRIRLSARGPMGQSKGGWFVVFEISQRNPQREIVAPPATQPAAR